MRCLAPIFSVAALAMPAAAQSAKFIKVEVRVPDSGPMSKQGKKKEFPESVNIRMPLALAKSFLKTIEGLELKVNGDSRPGCKVDELLDMLNEFRAGDLLLEVNTSDGGYVKISLE